MKSQHHADTRDAKLPQSIEHTKPYDSQNSLMLQCFDQFSTPPKRHDALVNIRLPVNSPHCPAKKQTKEHFSEQVVLTTKDGSTPDVRINIRRY